MKSGRPNVGRVLLGGIMAGAFINAAKYLIHGLFLNPQWTAAFAALGKTPTGWATFIPSNFLVGIIGVWSYAKFRLLRIEVRSEYDVPGCAIGKVVRSGTHKGDFPAIKPLGDAVRIAMAAFYTFEAASEKLTADKIYYDQASALQQMLAKETATSAA